MPLGPVEYILIMFPGNQFRGEIVPALQELVDNHTIRILDLACYAVPRAPPGAPH